MVRPISQNQSNLNSFELNEVCISDFGISRTISSVNTTATSIIGSQEFVPPEIILMAKNKASEMQMKGEDSLKIDIYGFGVVCWMIINESIDAPKHLFKQIFKLSETQNPILKLEIDYQSKNQEEKEIISKIQKIINECISWNAKDRPNFDKITLILQELFINSFGNNIQSTLIQIIQKYGHLF